jgi:MinD superfamily P-loop ATPase
MYVVTLVTQKGGSGKSTLTMGLAVAAMEDANRVARHGIKLAPTAHQPLSAR